MSKHAVVVVDLQSEYLPTGKHSRVGIEQAVANAARVIAQARAAKPEREPRKSPMKFKGASAA